MTKYILFLLLLFPSIVIGQKGHDPFARSRRLPDLSLGAGVMLNTQQTFSVEGLSVQLNTDWLNYDRNYLLGAEASSNIQKIQQASSDQLAQRGILQGLVYNQTIFALRGGYISDNNWMLVAGLGVESLKQFRHYKFQGESYYNATGTSSNLFYYKLSAMYQHNYLIYEAFYSRRGIGVGVSYFLAY